MEERHVRLVYPPNLVQVPVISQLIRRHEVTVNILRAQISEQSGWLEAIITGTAEEIQDAFVWLESKGIRIEALD